ncbi:MAG: MFS transporter [Bacteroidota bacterium]
MSKKRQQNGFAVYALAFGNFAAGISSLIVAGISSEMAMDLGVSVAKVGQLVTVFALVYAIGSPLVSAMTGKTERRGLLIAGMSMVLVGNGILALANDYALAVSGRIISAIGSAAFVPLAALVGISMAVKGNKGRITAIVFSGAVIATAVGVPLGTFIGINFDWHYSFGAVSVLALISILLILGMVPLRIKTPIANFNTLKQVFKDRLLTIFLAVTVLQFGGQMVLFAFISPWLIETTSLGPMGIVTMLLLAGLGGMVGNFITGRATDRYGSRATQLVLIVLLVGIMPLLNLMGHNLFLGGALIFLWGLVGQGFVAPQLVRIESVNPPLSSASLSLNATFINIGISLGAIIGGTFLDNFGVESLTWAATGVVLLSLLVFLYSWKIEDKCLKANVLLTDS